MELADYLRVLQRRWLIVALATLLGLAVGFFTASDEESPVTYSATQTLSVVQPTISQTAPSVSFTPSQLAVYATVGEVPVQVAEALDYPGTPQELASSIITEPDDTVGVLRITATDDDGARAAAIANTFGRKLRTVLISDAERQVRAEIAVATRQVDQLQRRTNELDARIAQAPPDAAVLTAQRDALINQYRIAYDELQALQERTLAGDPVVILENAVPERATQGLSAPTSRPARMALFGAVGFLLGAALALVLDRLDTRIRTKEDAEVASGLPVLAEIPFLPRRHRHELISATRPASPFAEAYRSLRSTLAFARGIVLEPRDDGGADPGVPLGRDIDAEPTVILVTSSGPYEGKTTTIANLAASYAETGRSVLVLDCDFRRPRLHQIFGTREIPGLADTLEDPGRFHADHEVLCATSVDGVRLVPAGTPTDNPARLFTRARTLVEASRRQADVVLIDTPPYLVANDASELIPWVDAVVVVVKSRRTSQGPTERMIENMARQQAPVAGVVLVGTDQTQTGYSPYYYHRANARTEKAHRGWRRALRMGPPKDKKRSKRGTEDAVGQTPPPAPVDVSDPILLGAADPATAEASDTTNASDEAEQLETSADGDTALSDTAGAEVDAERLDTAEALDITDADDDKAIGVPDDPSTTNGGPAGQVDGTGVLPTPTTAP